MIEYPAFDETKVKIIEKQTENPNKKNNQTRKKERRLKQQIKKKFIKK